MQMRRRARARFLLKPALPKSGVGFDGPAKADTTERERVRLSAEAGHLRNV